MSDPNAASHAAPGLPAPRSKGVEAVTNTEGLLRLVERFGLPLVMLAVILYWAKNDVVMPLLQAHFEVVQQIVRGQEIHSEKLDTIGDKLEELIRVTK